VKETKSLKYSTVPVRGKTVIDAKALLACDTLTFRAICVSYFKVSASHVNDTFALMTVLPLTAYTDLLKFRGGQRLKYFLFISIDSGLRIIRLVEHRKDLKVVEYIA
jgi:hypothetical protein